MVDSSCCLPADLLRHWKITVASHQLIVGDRSYRDGVDILPGDFYELLKEGKTKLSTAAPPTGEFVEAFNKAARLAPNVLCLTLSASFSVAYRNAVAAKVILDRNRSGSDGIRFEVLDSQSAAGAAGLIALAAARWAAAGHTLDQVMSGARTLAPKVNLLALLDTLVYLGRSGRVGYLQAWAGSLLGVKPLVELNMGEARILERPISRAKATQRLFEVISQRAGSAPVFANVMEADSAQDTQKLLSDIRTNLNCCQVFVSQFSPVMGAHTGPGLLAVAFHSETGPPAPAAY